MAVRKQLSHDTRTREKIQTSQLINRLQDNAFGKIELTQSQLKSIEILLRKSLPDLTTVTLEGSDSNPVKIVTKVELLGVRAGGDG